jgi:restriction system protein
MPKGKRGNNSIFDALAGLTLIGLAMLWLKTFDRALTLKAAIFVVAILASVIIILYLRRRRKLISSGIAEIDKMSGTMFEQLLLESFRKLDYKGKTTQEYGDYGADLLLVKDDVKYVIQAKRWNQKVGVKAVQEIVAAIKHYKADRGMVITNNFFTKNAEHLARSNNIELWDRTKLIEFMSQGTVQELVETINEIEPVAQDRNLCPRCGNKLVVRNGQRGKFIGCTGFPKCRYTHDYQ